jgi:peptide chain release factor 2
LSWKTCIIVSTPCARLSAFSRSVFDLANKRDRLAELDKQAAASDLWDDADRAQTVMRGASRLRKELAEWEALESRIADTGELISLGDASLNNELAREIEELEVIAESLEFRTMLSDRYDAEDAILAIHAGAGGIDAMDWAGMLLRMYLRWAEANALKAEVLDQSEGEEAGLKSATLSIAGDWAYGYLRSERGVHRLVRLSPFDSASRRHTSFALIEVWPDVHHAPEVQIDPNDLVVETFRAGGAGGQHVQKNETAIRITHVPTGIVVSCQNERSQTQNRESAMRVLQARLLELERVKQEEEKAVLKGKHVQAEFGNQIRSYVVHPYQMVKDHRTQHETANVDAVLNGRLNEFMEAYLRSQG